MSEGCICCANGNDLPDGEYCRACGREGTATGLRAAVIRARGRQEPPSVPVQFDGDDLQATISGLTAENEGLRKLVRGAYEEGFSEGMREHTSSRGGKNWRESKTRLAFEALATSAVSDAERLSERGSK